VNVLNRILIAFICLALIAGAITVIAFAWIAPQNSIDGLRDAVDWLEDNDGDLERVLLTTVCALIALIALTVFLLEAVPRASQSVAVGDLHGGDASLSTASIATRVEEAVRQVPHVSDARAHVSRRRKGVRVDLDLQVDPDANLAEVTDAAVESARDVLTNRVHVPLAEPPRARIHYRELGTQRAQAQARARPATAPPAQAPDPAPAPHPAVVGGDGPGETVAAGPSEAAADEPAREER
jgi:hypothetical protein